MARYVIDPDVALALARDRTAVPAEHQLLAPTLIRSQLLSRLYQAVQRGDLAKREAADQLDHVRALRLRLLGDRVLQAQAWRLAERLGWDDTLVAEYLALTQLQADAFVTFDTALAAAVEGIVVTAPPSVLGATRRPTST